MTQTHLEPMFKQSPSLCSRVLNHTEGEGCGHGAVRWCCNQVGVDMNKQCSVFCS